MSFRQISTAFIVGQQIMCQITDLYLYYILLERYWENVYTLLWEHLINNAPLSVNQCGFQSGRSIVISLLTNTHDWHRYLD